MAGLESLLHRVGTQMILYSLLITIASAERKCSVGSRPFGGCGKVILSKCKMVTAAGSMSEFSPHRFNRHSRFGSHAQAIGKHLLKPVKLARIFLLTFWARLLRSLEKTSGLTVKLYPGTVMISRAAR